jgi:hypothetical protein
MRAVKPVPCPHCTRLIAKHLSSCPFCKNEVSFGEDGDDKPTACPKCGRPYQLKLGACPFCNREAKTSPASDPQPPSPSKPPSVLAPPHERQSSRPPPSEVVPPKPEPPAVLTALAAPLAVGVLGTAFALVAAATDTSLSPNWLSPASKGVAFVFGAVATLLFVRVRGERVREQLEDDGRAWAFPLVVGLAFGLVTIGSAGLTYAVGMLVNSSGGAEEETTCTVTAVATLESNGKPWETDLTCNVNGEVFTTRVALAQPSRPNIDEKVPVKLRKGRLGIWLRSR